MLEKTPGGVICAHCRGMGADTLCPYCRRPVCTACLDSDRCPEPHPWQVRLGLGRRLRDIDPEGKIGMVRYPLGAGLGAHVLATGEEVVGWPLLEHGGRDVELQLPMTAGPATLARCAVTYTLHKGPQGEVYREYHDPLLALGSVTDAELGQVRLLERPAHALAARLWLLRDGATAVLASASRVDVLDLAGHRAPRVVDLKGEMMFDLALSSEARLAVAAVFGRLRCFDLDSGGPRGSVQLDDEDVTAVALGGDRVAAVDAELRLHVYGVSAALADRWPRQLRSDVEARGRLGPDQLALSPDGRLLALRQRRKRVLVLNLDSGERQVLRAHTDTVSFVRFAVGGRLLVTADDDNRVCFWPRSGDRLVSGD